MNTRLKADLMLLLVAFCWGFSYLLIDICLAEINPLNLNAIRFLMACFSAVLISYPKFRKISKQTVKYSIILGIALVFIYIGATYGVVYTSISNTGFLCALSVIFTPVISSIVFRKVPEKKLILVVCMSLIGIALLTISDDFSFQSGQLRGDLLCIMCAFVYAIDLLITEKAVALQEVDPYQLGVLQLGVTGLIFLVLSFLFDLPRLPNSINIWAAVVFLSILCTGVAFVAQSIAQKYTTASHVGVIFSLEPVFAGIVAFVFAGEVLTSRAYFGAVLMITSIFVMEIDFSGLMRRWKNRNSQ